MVFFLSVMCILTGVSMASTIPFIDKEWELWKLMYGKSYPNLEEDQARRGIWLDNLEKIDAHNAQYLQGNTMYEMTMNQFGDLTPMEFANLYTDARISEMVNYTDDALFGFEMEELEEMEEINDLPQEVDWRKMHYVGKIKDQGMCLSCYAFTAVGALEGQLAKKKKQLIELSVQNIIDCSDEYRNFGCRGGLPYHAFQYIRDHGIESEQSYPYQAKKNDKCSFNNSKSVIKIKGFRRIKNYSEKQLAAVIRRVGPLSVLICSAHDSWRFYKSGILDNADCNNKKIDHAVLLIGYVDEHPTGYWIIKNSWGTSWGERGYIRLVKGKNMCKITHCASYPII
ncbi:cathepsin K-like [Scyliorhinus torazame]|uniref:Uncharacterized protein n=1 Tax=Scyliorhinus torazame TaxID=75743 RepID=A0A401PSG6_SCYTO|nr:hypothetical protein [Scyliorhinus torazame]